MNVVFEWRGAQGYRFRNQVVKHIVDHYCLDLSIDSSAHSSSIDIVRQKTPSIRGAKATARQIRLQGRAVVWQKRREKATQPQRKGFPKQSNLDNFKLQQLAVRTTG